MKPIGVLLMTFGAATTPEDVPAYLASTRRGRPAPGDLVAEFQRRVRLVGGSPLIRITSQQAKALESLLNAHHPDHARFRVRAGMRHTAPFIKNALQQFAAEGIRQVVGVIMSPQYSPYIMGGYLTAVEEARAAIPGLDVRVAGAWHTEPGFITALAKRVRDALDKLPAGHRSAIPVLMTAHSLPKPVADKEPGYIDQLKDTAKAVATAVGLSDSQWQFAYQSAGHTAEEWLRPDIKDLLPALRQSGHRNALIVPVQFLADHLEVLYDLDIAAAQQAKEAGIEMRRIDMFNDMPAFIETLAGVVRRELAGVNWDRYSKAIALIDKANQADPNTLTVNGYTAPKELLHAVMMTEWVSKLRPDASEALLLAARAHHIMRWERPRDSYPKGRTGYLRWRTDLHRFHAQQAAAIMAECGYDHAAIERVGALIHKEGLVSGDPEVQALEDGLCLDFLQTQYDDLIAKLDDAKMIDVLRKTLVKMSGAGKAAALGLPFSPHGLALLEQALTAKA